MSFCFTFGEIEHTLKNCNKECEIYKKFCQNYNDDYNECLKKYTTFYQVFKIIFITGTYWTWYLILGFISILLFGSIISFILSIVFYILRKILKKIKKFNEQIPEFESV